MARTYHVRWNVPRILNEVGDLPDAPFDVWVVWVIPDTHPLKPDSTVLMALIEADDAGAAEAILLGAYEDACFRLVLYLDPEENPDVVANTRTEIEKAGVIYKAAVEEE
jgi:hypothetical protein